MKKKLLICTTHLPYPVRKNGISVRYFPIIAHLSKRFDVHLLVVTDYPVPQEEVDEARQYIKECSIYVRQPQSVSLLRKIVVRLTSLIPGQLPFPMRCYDESLIESFIKDVVENNEYDTALTVCPPYAHLVLKHVKAKGFVMDAIDSVYVYMMRDTKNNPLDIWDTESVKRWENMLIDRMDYTSFVSATDISLLCPQDIDARKVGVLPNGIYINDYSRERIPTDGFVLGYLGHMGYPPNIEAGKRLASIYLDLRNTYPEFRLFIIGRLPANEIRALANNPGVTVTGDVDSIWPYVNAVDTFVFPMAYGAGQQNKLLDAMYAGRPVVTTSVGNGGVGAIDGESALVADSDEDIKNAIIRLYKDHALRERVGLGGQKLATETYHWPSLLKHLEECYFPDR